MTMNYKRPALKPETWKALEQYKATGQTPDGAIQELLKSQGIEVQS